MRPRSGVSSRRCRFDCSVCFLFLLLTSSSSSSSSRSSSSSPASCRKSMTSFHNTFYSSSVVLTPSRFLSHFSQSIKVIRPGNSTSPSLMASSNVAPSGLPATCFDMPKESAVCAQDLSLRAQNGPRGEPYGAPYSPAERRTQPTRPKGPRGEPTRGKERRSQPTRPDRTARRA